MSLYIKLDKEINPQQLLQKIKHEVNEHRKSHSLENSILFIDIKPIVHVVDGLSRIDIKKDLEDQND